VVQLFEKFANIRHVVNGFFDQNTIKTLRVMAHILFHCPTHRDHILGASQHLWRGVDARYRVYQANRLVDQAGEPTCASAQVTNGMVFGKQSVANDMM
jgi:hypothetical protein